MTPNQWKQLRNGMIAGVTLLIASFLGTNSEYSKMLFDMLKMDAGVEAPSQEPSEAPYKVEPVPPMVPPSPTEKVPSGAPEEPTHGDDSGDQLEPGYGGECALDEETAANGRCVAKATKTNHRTPPEPGSVPQCEDWQVRLPYGQCGVWI